MKAPKIKSRLQHWIYLLAGAGSLPSDTSDQKLRKAVLVFLASIYCVAGTLWGCTYLALGLLWTSIFPLGYAAISGASLVYFFNTKRYGVFRFTQLSLILILPFMVHFSLGGFVASSAVIIWSILSPLGALMFAGTHRAGPWFAAYLALMALTGVFGEDLAQKAADIPAVVVTTFFVMNLGGVSAIVFTLLRYFVRERERAMEVLDRQHHMVLEEKERLDKIKSVMANFVPEIAKEIIERDPEKAFMKRYVRDATVLFLDIEGFTLLIQEYPLERINRVIEQYFSVFYDLIRHHGGDINETAGDGLMVIFLHTDPVQHARNAVATALEIKQKTREMSTAEDSSLFPVRVNIGISSGEVYLGSTKLSGAEGDRWTFTASGPVTIIAARLSDHANGGEILLAEETARRVERIFALTHLGKVRLKNFRNPSNVYKINAHSAESGDD